MCKLSLIIIIATLVIGAGVGGFATWKREGTFLRKNGATRGISEENGGGNTATKDAIYRAAKI